MKVPVQLAAVALAMLIATGAAAEGPRLAAEQVLRLGNGPEVETLDPHRTEGVSAANVMRDLFEGLLTEAADGSLVPGAAKGWTISDDLRVYTFKLRENGRWSNGDPLTAQDFVAGMRRSVDPATGSNYSQMLSPIENADAVIEGKLPPDKLGVDALDALTLRIRLRGPTPYLLGMLVHASSAPIHRASLAEHGAQFAQPGKLVSNGAYRLAERVVQSHVMLERNPYYWNNARTTVERVFHLNTEDINSELKRFRAGEIDWTYQIPASQVDWIRRHLGDVLLTHTYLGVYYYGLNLSKPPFKDNPALRKALAMAIDRDVIANKVMGTGEQPANSWVPPGVSGHRSALAPWAGLTREQSLTEARKLYAQAGYSAERPARVEIRYNTHDDHKKVATTIAAMWKQWLGVETVLINEEWKVFLQNRRLRSKTQAFRVGWIGDYNDANSFMEIHHSTHGLNDSVYRSPEFDRLLARASVEPDPARRADLMFEAERQLLEDLPVIPIYFYVTKHLIAPYVVGWTGNIMDHHYTRTLKVLEHGGDRPGGR
ncbi:MAG: peptide ABC transporter substrate-binding protein [Panacagrimonas sp.]